MTEKLLYLALDVFTLFVPFIRSFEIKYIDYKAKWKYLFSGIAVFSSIFLIWDVIFTHYGIWGFNPTYLTGISVGNLPIEEVLFFVVVPYSCLFIYEVLNRFLAFNPLEKVSIQVSWILVAILLLVGFGNLGKLYTSITFIGLAIFMVYLLLVEKPHWLPNFYRAYIISLIPFILMNGALTGSFTEQPIVWYNDNFNLGIRLFTIPIEDTQYMLLLLLGVTYVYEKMRARDERLKGNI